MIKYYILEDLMEYHSVKPFQSSYFPIMHWLAWSSVILKHLKTFRKACICMCKAGSVLAWGKSVVMSEGDRLWKLIHWSLYAEFLCWRTMTLKYWAENCCALWKSLYVTLACCHFNGPESLAIDYSGELRYMRLQLWCTIRQSTIQVRSMDLLGQDYCMGRL